MPSGLIGDGGSRGPVLQVRQGIRPVFGVQVAVGGAGPWRVPGKEGTERGSPRLGWRYIPSPHGAFRPGLPGVPGGGGKRSEYVP